MTDQNKCPVCDNDGYIEVWDEEGDTIVATHECPRLLSDGHAPFNATGAEWAVCCRCGDHLGPGCVAVTGNDGPVCHECVPGEDHHVG